MGAVTLSLHLTISRVYLLWHHNINRIHATVRFWEAA